jgi:GTP pyrophosphokinase
LGHQCTGAKVNGRLVPLDYQLKNGDIIQIISSKQSNGPSPDWLQFVKTTKAKNRIRQWQREQFRGVSIQVGRELMERELRKHGMEVHENMRQEVLLEGAKKLGFNNVEDLFASLGDTKVTPAMVIGKIAPEKEIAKQPLRPEIEEKRKPKHNGFGVVVRGVDDVLVRFSKCCNPVPGDDIIGFTTRGKGVSVHRSDCINLSKEDQERIIEVAWDRDVQGTYPVDIEMVGSDRVNLLADVMTAISELNLYLNQAKARSKKGTAYINLTLEISNSDQIRLICNRIKKVDGIEQVYRVSRLVR